MNARFLAIGVLLASCAIAGCARPPAAGRPIAAGREEAEAVAAPENPAGGWIVRHRLAARVVPFAEQLPPPGGVRAPDSAVYRGEFGPDPKRPTNLFVTDTLTIRHAPGVAREVSFPFLLAKDLLLIGAGGPGVATHREGRMRPRDFWAEPPYDELQGYERARCVWLDLDPRFPTWPESMDVVVIYEGAIYDSLKPPKSAYARGFETTSGLIDPRGAYLAGSTFWIPARPDERFVFRCAIETPEDWHGVSQGALLSSGVDNRSVRWGMSLKKWRTNVWDSPQPMEEIYLIAGPYTLRQEERAGVAVMTFTYAATDEETCRRYIDGTERYLRLYGEKIGRYPFAKFALVENFWQTGYGMPSFTLLGDQVIRLPFILDTSYGHEILHNWWGNGVFVDIGRGNWCEGLTTYGADYLYKEQQSEAEARDYRRTSLQGYLDYVSANEDLPLRRFRERDDFATQAIGYGKSMMVFHQVRRLLGDEAFWAALQDVYRSHLFRRASWDDFFAAFGRRGGKDLSAWKEQWIERTGAPSLAIRSHETRREGDAYGIIVTLAQEQPELYDLRVPVRIGWNDTGAESTQVAALAEREARVSFHVNRPADWVAVDPDFDVLRRIHPAEIPPALSRTLGADTALVVLAAGMKPEISAAYLAVAQQWKNGARLAILEEKALGEAFVPGVPAWYLGVGALARARLSTLEGAARAEKPKGGVEWTVAGTTYPEGHGVVLAGGPPDRPENAWTLLEGFTPEQIAALGRKVPHYGKYGYLVFEGDRNVTKGSWEISSSPLRAVLVKAGGAEQGAR